MIIKFSAVLGVFILPILMAGCSPALRNLAALGENRKQTRSYVKTQEDLFAKLRQDVADRSLKEGTPIDEVISVYGEPVLRKDRDYKGQLVQSLLYRNPLKFFSTDLVYLYFDKDSRLTGWEVTQQTLE